MFCLLFALSNENDERWAYYYCVDNAGGWGRQGWDVMGYQAKVWVWSWGYSGVGLDGRRGLVGRYESVSWEN